MVSLEERREKARERMRRYLARKRGQNVPKRKPGRPRKLAPALPLAEARARLLAHWEEFAKEGNEAGFLGSEDGYNVWLLHDSQTGVVRRVRFADGPETHAAIVKLLTSSMTFGLIGGGRERAARYVALLRETYDAQPETDLVARYGLRAVADITEYGRFMPREGETYHRVDGSQPRESTAGQTEQAREGPTMVTADKAP